MARNKRSKDKAATGSLKSVSAGKSQRVRFQPLFDRHQATVHKNRIKVRIGTWNVRTLHRAGKTKNLFKEQKQLSVNIMGINEMRWTGCGITRQGDYTIIYSGGSKHLLGVGVVMDKTTAKSLAGYEALSDRVVKLHAQPFNLSIIQAYAPTSTASDAELEKFYLALNQAKKQCKNNEITVVMGDLNAKVGASR